MFQYLALESGTTVLELTALPYALVSYGIQVAALNENELGLLYADVEEPITVDVTGCTAAEAYVNVNALNALLDQAWRWRQGQPVDAVLLAIEAQGGSNTLKAAVLGRPNGGAAPTTMPPTWDAAIGRYIIRGVELTLVRHGQWLDPDTESGTSTSAANPTVQSIAISTSVTRSSPTKLACDVRNGITTGGILDTGYILTASTANRLQIYEAESGSLGTNVTSVNDAANFARGNFVARYAPGVLSSTIGFSVSPAFDTNVQRIAFYAAVRNNSATTTWTIQIIGSWSITASVITPIDASTTNTRIVFLGILNTGVYLSALGERFDAFSLQLTASAASGTLDIDYVVVQAVDDETSAAVALYNPSPVGTSTKGVAAAAPTTLDHRLLTKPDPVVSAIGFPAGGTIPVPYAGSPIVYTRGSCVATLIGTTGTLWRIWNGVVMNTTWTATRSPAYLIPE